VRVPPEMMAPERLTVEVLALITAPVLVTLMPLLNSRMPVVA
jgi:hypothetical protein